MVSAVAAATILAAAAGPTLGVPATVPGSAVGPESFATWAAAGVAGRTGFLMKKVGTRAIAIISMTAQSVRLSMSRQSAVFSRQ